MVAGRSRLFGSWVKGDGALSDLLSVSFRTSGAFRTFGGQEQQDVRQCWGTTRRLAGSPSPPNSRLPTPDSRQRAIQRRVVM
jgi:hypothetical protein